MFKWKKKRRSSKIKQKKPSSAVYPYKRILETGRQQLFHNISVPVLSLQSVTMISTKEKLTNEYCII